MKNLYKYVLTLGVALLWLLPSARAQITSYSPTEIKSGGSVYITYESPMSHAPAATVNSINKISGDDINFTIPGIIHSATVYDGTKQSYVHYYAMPIFIGKEAATTTKEAVYMIATNLGSMPLTVIWEGLSVIANGGFVTPTSQQMTAGDTAQTLSHSLNIIIGTLATPTFQWQVKPLNGTWTNIAGATAKTYSPGQMNNPGVYFYRVYYNSSTYSSEAVIFVGGSVEPEPTVVIGTLTPSTQQISSGTEPAILNHTGHENVTSRQWQRRTRIDGVTSAWTDIEGATGDTYAPGVLTNTGSANSSYFYRIILNGDNSYIAGTSTVIVQPATQTLVTGAITPASQEIESGTASATLTHTGHQGVTSRQWQQSVVDPNSGTLGTWLNVSGATGETYTPATYTNTGTQNITYSYRIVINGDSSLTSDIATLVVTPASATVNPGGITPASQEIESGSIPATLGHTGHQGVTSRQWQRRIAFPQIMQTLWEDVTDNSDPTSETYSPGQSVNNLTMNIIYSYRVKINGTETYSAEATVTITPASSGAVVTGGLTPSAQEIDSGVAPAALTHTGHQNVTSRQWQLTVQDPSGVVQPSWINIFGAIGESYSPNAISNRGNDNITYLYRIVINGDPGLTSDIATVVIKPASAATVTPGSITPASQQIESGGFSTALTHTGHANVTSRQWQRRVTSAGELNNFWTNISGATGETYSPGQLTNSVATNVVYSYRVRINNTETYSAEAVITVTPPGVQVNPGGITPQTQDIIYTGTPEPLVHTGHSGVTSRQWQRVTYPRTNTWEDVAGATGISYTPGTITHSGLKANNEDIYIYRVVVNGDPSLVSEAGAILLYPSGGNPGVITPETQTIESGETTLELTSNASGGGIPPKGDIGGAADLHCLQWQQKTGAGEWINIQGATEMTYSPGTLLNPGSADLEYSFRVYINNDPARVSTAATVTVTPFVDPGSVTPVSQTVESGETPLQLVHTGSQNVTSRQWQYRSGSSWGDITGATGDIYTPAALTNNYSGNLTYYYRVVVNGNSNKISGEAAIITKPNPLANINKGQITPRTQTVEVGEIPEMLSHTGHGEVVSRRWEMKRSDQGALYWKTIPGVTGATYSPPAFDEPGTYQFQIRLNDISNLYTPITTIVVEDNLDPGYISPATQNMSSGGVAKTLTHEGLAGSRGRQWQIKVDDGQWEDIAGATGITYEPGRLYFNSSGELVIATGYHYRVVIGGDESLASQPAVVNVGNYFSGNPNVGYIAPASKTIASGEDAGTLTHSGGENIYTRQWQRKVYSGEWADIPGATGETFSPGQLYLDTSGGFIPIDNKTPYSYRVKTTNTVNDSEVNSAEAVITVDASIGIFRIGEVAPKSQTVILGTKPLSLFLTEVSGGSGDYTYHWQKFNGASGWTDIPGATDKTYSPGILSVHETHLFRVAVQSGDVIKFAEGSVKVVSNPAVSTNLDTTKNYTSKYVFMAATQSDANTHLSIPSVVYYDDLGRPVQSVEVAASPSKYDIITPIEYDMMGRDDAKSHLPYVGSGRTGGYVASAITDKATFYRNLYGSGDSNYSFVEKAYEASALNKPLSQYNAGSVYRSGGGKKVTYGYSINSSGEVLKLSVDATGNIQASWYVSGALYKNTVTNEDGLTVTTYTDGLGKTVMEQTSDGTTKMKTYYAYDNKQLLRWVISPEGSKSLNSGNSLAPSHSTLVNYAYMYKYDDSGNLTEKRLPGADPVKFIYDSARRLIASQDGNQVGKWILYKYDNFDRIVGQKLTSSSESLIKSNFTGAYNNASNTLLAEYKYDTYTGVPDLWSGHSVSGMLAHYHNSPRGLKTYEKVGVLGESGFVERVFYYDKKKCRPVLTAELSGIFKSEYSTDYDFIGNVVHSLESHEWTESGADKLYQIETDNSYDHRGRLLSTTTGFMECYKDMWGVWQLPADYPTATVRYGYDDLGRLTGKEYGEGSTAFTSAMTYNIQGWLTSQKSRHFNMNLGYFNAGRYSGNITQWSWLRPEYAADQTPRHTYDLSYDLFGRLLTGTSSDSFTETVERSGIHSSDSGYDLNGNIRSMRRSDSGGYTADYTYHYQGNKLTSLTDVLGEEGFNYTYDANGNLVRDERKGLEFKYNLLNLVSEVTDNTSSARTKANYSYSSDGVKLKVRGAQGEGYDYIGSMTLERGAGGSLNGMEALFAGGQFKVGQSTEVLYFETDHLGSVRSVIDNAGDVVTTNDYYPFGTRHSGSDIEVDDNFRYRFNGKEEQLTGNLGLLDYGARMYDSEIGRWSVPDPLAERYFSLSPFVYCNNNPVKFIDPYGMAYTTGSQAEVAALLEELQRQSRKNEAKMMFNNMLLSGGGLSKERETALRNENSTLMGTNIAIIGIQVELEIMNRSNQMYNVTRTDEFGENTGASAFNFETREFDIMLPTAGTLDVIVHEFFHAFQFEMGYFSTGPNGVPFYDKHDEIAAYNRGALFGGPTYTLGTLPEVYKDLPDGPMNVTNHPNIKYNINNPSALQSMAVNSFSAFRVNKRTYSNPEQKNNR